MFRFIIKCVLIPAAAIFLIYELNKNYVPINDENYWDLVKFDVLKLESPDIQIANIGSSHAECGFDYTMLTKQGYDCFNFANTSQSYDYDYGILKEYGQYMSPGSVLFIPVSYFSFNNEVVNAKEAQALSIRYYRILSPENMPNYDLYVDIVSHKLPILSAGSNITKLFAEWFPDLSIIAHAAGSEVSAEQFSSWARDRYSRHFDNKEEYFLAERITELYDIIAYCREHDVTPVLITTPFTSFYCDLVSAEFRMEFYAKIDAIVSDTGVNYYDYSYDERFRDNLELFSDADHLNADGARFFMEILTDEVSEMERFGF